MNQLYTFLFVAFPLAVSALSYGASVPCNEPPPPPPPAYIIAEPEPAYVPAYIAPTPAYVAPAYVAPAYVAPTTPCSTTTTPCTTTTTSTCSSALPTTTFCTTTGYPTPVSAPQYNGNYHIPTLLKSFWGSCMNYVNSYGYGSQNTPKYTSQGAAYFNPTTSAYMSQSSTSTTTSTVTRTVTVTSSTSSSTPGAKKSNASRHASINLIGSFIIMFSVSLLFA